MRIVYIASEIAPFASTGGLAEVMGGLPAAMAARGHAAMRIMPMYRTVLPGGPCAAADTGLRIQIPVGFRRYHGEVWKAAEPAPETYFIRRDEFFDRTHLYNTPERDYDDNFERFVFFQKAAVEAIDRLELKPDIVHCNDWQTGLVPQFLEHGTHGTRRGRREKVAFTIHNLAYQGIFPGADFPLLHLPFASLSIQAMEYYTNIDCMKCGITCADLVTTVSDTYAREIREESHGYGLHGVLAGAQDRLVGIVNGIDEEAWNPATDAGIARTFSPEALEGKRACREDLLRMSHLKAGKGTLILAMVSRLTEQKGVDILDGALPDLMARDVVLVVLGSGERGFESLCARWAEKRPGRVYVRLAFDPGMARRIHAGSDAFLLPSRFEPCGLSQFYSMRYGTLPIAHGVGGLADTIADMAGPEGTGFLFRAYAASSLVGAVDRALALRADPAAWQLAMQRAMRGNYAWTRSAEAYESQYRRILQGA